MTSFTLTRSEQWSPVEVPWLPRGPRLPARAWWLGALLAGCLATVLAGPLLAPADPNALDLSRKLLPPGTDGLLGTDQLGRDVLSRLLTGGRVAVLTGLLAVAGTMALAILTGALAGVAGGRVDLALVALFDLLLSLPGLLVTLALLGIFGTGPMSLVLALVGVSWASEARVIRAAVQEVRGSQYVDAAQALGARPGHVLLRHIGPNVGSTLVVLASLNLAEVLLVVSALGFLGLGAQPPDADWGTLLADSRPYFSQAPWLMLAPGACIAGFSLLASLVGDAFRDRLDPRLGR